MDDDEALKNAMAVLRARRNPETLVAIAKNNAAARKGKPLTEEHKAALRDAQAARREREKSERPAAASPTEDAEPKRPRGRPKKIANESSS